MNTSFKYSAFISYSHSDEKIALWLRKAIEGYKIPKDLRNEANSALAKLPVFRDRDELPTSADLGGSISGALAVSKSLIVICSPKSAQSMWVNAEVEAFKKLGREAFIQCLIVDGEPNASDKSDISDDLECFCPALRFKLDEAGNYTEERTEPIAADIRKNKDSKSVALLRLIAGLMGLGFDDLYRRRERHRRKILAGISAVLLMTGSGLAWWRFTPEGQIFECEYYFKNYIEKASDDGRQKAIYEFINAEFDELGILKEKQKLKVVSFSQLEQIEFVLQTITDIDYEARVYQVLAQTIGVLGDRKKELVYLDKIQRVAEKVNYKPYQAGIYLALAQAAGNLDEKEKGVFYLNKAEQIADTITEKGPKFLMVYPSLIRAANVLGEKEKGNLYLNRLEELAEKNNDAEIHLLLYKSLVQLASILGEKGKGFSYLDKLQKVSEKNNNLSMKVYTYQALVESVGALGEKSKGQTYLEKVFQEVKKITADKEEQAHLYQIIFQTASELGLTKQRYLEHALQATEEITDEKNKVKLYQVLAQTADTREKKEKIVVYLEKAQPAAEKINNAKVFQYLAKATSILGNKNKALQLAQRATRIAKTSTDSGVRTTVFKTSAEIYAQAGLYRNGCDLARDNTNADDAAQITAIVLREYDGGIIEKVRKNWGKLLQFANNNS
jgi:hypothetical protein